MNEFSLSTRLFLKAYPWRRIDPVPWTRLEKPLSRCRVALVSTAGFVGPSDEPFDKTVRGGDPSYSVIPSDTPVTLLRDYHRSESSITGGSLPTRIWRFPMDRLRELASRGRIGSSNRRHLSFMGSLTATARLQRDVLPQAARLLQEDEVDVALLVPV